MSKNSKDLSLGIERFIDGLGRLVIPKEMRDSLNFDNNQLVTVKLFKNHIQIEKSVTSCFFCGNIDDISFYKNHPICNHCLNDMLDKFKTITTE